MEEARRASGTAPAPETGHRQHPAFTDQRPELPGGRDERDQIDHRNAALQDLSSQPILGCYEPFRVHFGYSCQLSYHRSRRWLNRRESKTDGPVSVGAVTVPDVTPAIEAIDLVKRFGGTAFDRPAVDGVSFAVPPGTVLGLLGPNGAGKTTTVRMMTTLTKPTSGTARVAGYDVCREPDKVRRSMGLTGQVATVDELLTGRENIRMVGGLYGIRRKELDTAGKPTAGTVFHRRRRRPRRQVLLRADAHDGSTSPSACWRRRRCCSSTSRPPGWILAAAATCGTCCVAWSSRAPRCC